MNRSHTENKDAAARAEMLLQQFFDGRLSFEEAKELVDYGDRHPAFHAFALKNLEVDQLFRFFSKLKEKPIVASPARESDGTVSGKSELILSSPVSLFPGQSRSRVPEAIDFDVLLRLAAESPPSPTAPRNDPKPVRPVGRSKPRSVRPSRPERILPLFIACFLLFGGIVFLEFQYKTNTPQNAFDSVARIVESVDAVWEEGVDAFKVGRELEPCVLKLRSGVVKLEFDNGSEVVLEGPSEFLVKGKNAAFNQHGRLSAYVPPRGVGFEVASPTATVIDLGTRFSMDVSEGRAEVHVLQGKVEVRQLTQDKLLLTGGLAGLFDLKPSTRPVAADPSTFFSDEKLRERKAAYAAGRQIVWEAARRRRSADTSLVASLDAATVYGCRRIDGCRPEDAAWRFLSAAAAAEWSVPGEYRDMTLVAVVRIDDMTKNFGNVLCLGNAILETRGEFLWLLERNGALHFHIHGDGIQRFETPSVIRPRDRKTWMQLAVVADAPNRRIRHYVDGREVASMPWNRPVALRMERGTVGNDPPGARKRTTRFWNGDIDSFDVYSRALSGTEIANLYESTH